MSSAGYNTAKAVNRLQRSMTKASVIGSRQYDKDKARPMKLTVKQKLRKWLMDDSDEYITIPAASQDVNIQSQGFRLDVYSASGGTIIETTKYDRQKDDHKHSLHVVTDDKELGEELAKIITMESLR